MRDRLWNQLTTNCEGTLVLNREWAFRAYADVVIVVVAGVTPWFSWSLVVYRRSALSMTSCPHPDLLFTTTRRGPSCRLIHSGAVHGVLSHAGVLVLLLRALPYGLPVFLLLLLLLLFLLFSLFVLFCLVMVMVELEFRVIYACHLDRDPTVILVLLGHRRQPRRLVGQQRVVLLRVLLLLPHAEKCRVQLVSFRPIMFVIPNLVLSFKG